MTIYCQARLRASGAPALGSSRRRGELGLRVCAESPRRESRVRAPLERADTRSLKADAPPAVDVMFCFAILSLVCQKTKQLLIRRKRPAK